MGSRQIIFLSGALDYLDRVKQCMTMSMVSLWRKGVLADRRLNALTGKAIQPVPMTPN